MFKGNVNITSAVTQAMKKDQAALGDHPDFETLLAFQSRKLTGEDEEQVRGHLGLCRDCAEFLLFQACRNRGFSGRLRGLRRRLRNGPPRITEGVRGLFSEQVTVGKLAPAYLVCVAVLVAPSYFLLWNARSEINALSKPKAGALIVDVRPETRSLGSLPSAQGTLVDLARDDHFFTLILPSQPGDFKTYTLRFLDSQEQEIWRTDDLEVDKYRQATITLPRRFITKPGLYHVEISHPQKPRESRVYLITVRFDE